MTYRPLSKRGVPDAGLDTLHDGVPMWMMEPLCSWLEQFLYLQIFNRTAFTSNMALISDVEMALQHPPFARWGSQSAADGALQAVRTDQTFALDLTDYITQHVDLDRDQLLNLAQILVKSGSVWSLTQVSENSRFWMLTRRDLGAAKLAITDIRTSDQLAGDFLTEAWKAIASRNPDPAKAYDNAVNAVEAAAKPVISPKNTKATLGTIIADMNAKPAKWSFALGDVDVVIDMSQRLWQTQFRHGTQARGENTQQEADAAVHLAIPLVRYFIGGLVS